MTDKPGSRVHERWARLRFSVIGQLLAAPPAKGALRAALEQLAAREWRHPTTGAPVRFGVSTLERWYSAEPIILRSWTVLPRIFLDEYRPLLRIIIDAYSWGVISAMS